YGFRRASTLSKGERGHYERASVEPGRRLVELRLDDITGYEVGQQIDASVLVAGEKVDVTAVSKGKGFAGGMDRPNSRGQGGGNTAGGKGADTGTRNITGGPARWVPAPRLAASSRERRWLVISVTRK